MDAESTKKILQLDNPDSMRAVVTALVDGYTGERGQRRVHYYEKYSDRYPMFMVDLLGPPLDTMPSFNFHKHGAVFPVPNQAPRNVGAMLEEPHTQMRMIGKKVSDLFLPEIRARLAQGKPGDAVLKGGIPATSFGDIPVDKLFGINSVTIEPIQGKPLTINDDDILHNVFMLGAAAKAYMSRDSDERTKIVNAVGVLDKTDKEMHRLFKLMHTAMLNDPYYSTLIENEPYNNRSLKQFGLSIDSDQVAKAFSEHYEDFRKAYNYLYVNCPGEFPRSLQQWRFQGQKIPPGGIEFETPLDAAQTVLALALRTQEWQFGEPFSKYAALSKQLAAAPDAKAAASLLTSADAENLLINLKEAVESDSKEQAALLKLNEWRDRMLAPVSEGRPMAKAGEQWRGGRG